jgi:hypothetical protein
VVLERRISNCGRSPAGSRGSRSHHPHCGKLGVVSRRVCQPEKRKVDSSILSLTTSLG